MASSSRGRHPAHAGNFAGFYSRACSRAVHCHGCACSLDSPDPREIAGGEPSDFVFTSWRSVNTGDVAGASQVPAWPPWSHSRRPHRLAGPQPRGRPINDQEKMTMPTLTPQKLLKLQTPERKPIARRTERPTPRKREPLERSSYLRLWSLDPLTASWLR